jgi:hypothetical protein
MQRAIVLTLMCMAATTLFVGCTRTTDPAPTKGNEDAKVNPKAAQEAKAKYLLVSEPAGAKSVIDFKKEAKDGDEVVVVGRIGGSVTPFTGRAAFTIVDAKFKPCSEIEGDNCPTPWDYCCDAPDELAKGTILIKLTDSAGKTLPDDAKQLLDVKELQTIVVKGQTRRDESNSISVVATGIYIKKK